MRSLAAKRGGQLRLEQVLTRMRCSQCRQAAARAVITDSPIDKPPHEAMDGAKGRVTLVP